MKQLLLQQLNEVVQRLYPSTEVEVELAYPQEMSHGDFASNIAMKLAKPVGKNPREIAQSIVDSLSHEQAFSKLVSSIEIAGPGFINFKLQPNVFSTELAKIDQDFGKNNILDGKKVMIEYTDPNPFKVLHIGHLMSNTIGESLSRILAWSGAELKRACYQGDVGMHVAKSIWGLKAMGLDQLPKAGTLKEQVTYLGQAYAKGSTAYSDGELNVQDEIKAINKQVYEKNNEEINALYNWGRQVSLDYFETQYKTLGTKFDFYFFESEVFKPGLELVQEYLQKGIFEESKGAIIFPGEKYDLHTRVFLNAEGLPTYEAKELGLAKEKYKKYPYDVSVVITGNEINQYFQVLLKAMEFIYPELQEKTVHIGHGMLRLPQGKMSSRTGSVVAAEDLIHQAEEKVREKETKADEDISTPVAVGAIKFSIVSQSAGSDIIFDFEKSLSFEGDSGPYLQYTYARSQSLLAKAKQEGVEASTDLPESWETTEIEKLLLRFPEEVESALRQYSPHVIAHYLLQLARAYNSWYANTKIVDRSDATAPYKLSVVQSVAQVMKNGLYLLGIEVVEKM